MNLLTNISQLYCQVPRIINTSIIFFIRLLQVLREILREVQASMVPRTMLKEWAMTTFPSATDYWTFRKMFTLQLALAGFAEYVLHLSRLNPDMMYIHQVHNL